MLLHVAGANVAWHSRINPAGRLSVRINQVAGSMYARGAFEFLRLVFYLGIPYVALYLGWLDMRAMGLGFLDWAKGLRWAIVLALAAWSMLMFVWVPYLRATSMFAMKVDPEASSWPRRAVEVIYMQAHWAFYRATCILILAGILQDELAVYWGASAGIALTLVEAWADPRTRRLVGQLGDGEAALWSATQSIVNTVGFVLTRNNWLLALIHFSLEFSVPHLRAIPRPAPQGTQPSRLNVPNQS